MSARLRARFAVDWGKLLARGRPDAAIRNLGAAVVLACFAGCGPPPRSADLVILNGVEPESLDPAAITGQPDMRVARALFEGLVRLDPKTAEPIAGLAERWDISEDGLRYTFHLRSNLVWSTGRPLVARDADLSWRRTLDPSTACDYAGQMFHIKNAEAFNRGLLDDPSELGWRALDDRTFQVELRSPTPFFLDLCALPAFMIVPWFAIEAHGDRWLLHQPVPGNGPYLLEAWRIHDRIRLRRNPRYWNAGAVRSETVDILPIESPTTALNLYESGQADIIWDKGLIPGELMDVLRTRPDCHVFDYLGVFFLRFNVTKPPFDDARVRKALALAVDKRRIVERITRGGERPAVHFTPPGLPGYEPPQGLDFDPAAARQLLAEAGFPDGRGFPAFSYRFKSGKTDEQIGVELQAMWREHLGVRMELKQTEWKVFLAAQSALDYDVSRSSWIGDYNDPNTFLELFAGRSGNNRTGWSHPRYDLLLAEGNRQIDPVRRAAILRDAESILVRDEFPILPIYFYAGVNVFDPTRIDGIYFNRLDVHPLQAIGKR